MTALPSFPTLTLILFLTGAILEAFSLKGFSKMEKDHHESEKFHPFSKSRQAPTNFPPQCFQSWKRLPQNLFYILIDSAHLFPILLPVLKKANLKTFLGTFETVKQSKISQTHFKDPPPHPIHPPPQTLTPNPTRFLQLSHSQIVWFQPALSALPVS